MAGATEQPFLAITFLNGHTCIAICGLALNSCFYTFDAQSCSC